MSSSTSVSTTGLRDLLRWIIYAGVFAVPLLTVVVLNDSFFPFITGKNFAFRIIVEAIFAAWVLLALYDPQYRPKFSWLLAGVSALLAVMFFSSLLAEHSPTSFWSNYERMDGFVTLLHVGLYFLVAGAVLQTAKIWSIFLHWSVAVAAFVAWQGLMEFSAGAGRVAGTLGNAAYLAIYMLFHIFFVLYLAVRTKVLPYHIVYGLVALLFTFILLQTGTRGTAIGLATGLVAAVAYVAIFARSDSTYRKYALGALAVLVLAVGGFLAAKDSSYVQDNNALARIANIDLAKDLEIRTIIWGMALEGVKERPILGWGMGNFNFVFNEQYDPRLYAQEQWFDRVHNIAFDWLIAGGILGFLAYFSIFAAAFFYLVWLPWRQSDTSFTVLERGAIFGLLIGYLTHNLVVFDNIISYIFFGSLLAILHSRSAVMWPRFAEAKINPVIVTQMVAPVVALGLVATIYFVNVPGMQAAKDIITALRTQDLSGRLAGLEVALERDSFARQEIIEQLSQQAIAVSQLQDAPQSVKDAYAARTEAELQWLVEHKPGDARIHVFLASYYRAIGATEKAAEQFAIARELSPQKQSIIIQQGALAFNGADYETARDYFHEAYILDERNSEARQFLMAAYFYTGEIDEAQDLYDTGSEQFKSQAAASDFVLGAANAAGQSNLLVELYQMRVASDKATPQDWASLAFVYYEMDDNETAIATLEAAATALPAFADTATCIAGNIAAGREPQAVCD